MKANNKSQGWKQSSVGPWNDYQDDFTGGICPACGNYEIELAKDGHCRDENCKAARLKRQITSGAIKEVKLYKDGEWFVIRVHTEEGK